MLAKALYDNVAESPDELSFRKGDIMTVLERDTQGLEGWWLCSLHGRQGIVPGNRLKILVGMYDKQQPPQPSAYTKALPSSQYTAMHPALPAGSPTPSPAPSPAPGIPDAVYMLPPTHGKPSPHSLYQGLTKGSGPLQKSASPVQYEAAEQDVYQVPPGTGGPSHGQDIYQVPPSMSQNQDIYQIPPSMEKRSWTSSKAPGKVRDCRATREATPPRCQTNTQEELGAENGGKSLGASQTRRHFPLQEAQQAWRRI